MHQGDELIAKVSATTAIAARERRCPVRPRYAPQPHRAHQVVDRSVSQKPKSRGRIATLTGSKFDRILTWRSNARVLVMFEERVTLLSTKDSDSRFDGDAANAGSPHLAADRGAEDARQL